MKRFEQEMKQPLLDDTTDVSISVSAASSPESTVHPSASDQVTVCWGDILPWLVDAIEWEYWSAHILIVEHAVVRRGDTVAVEGNGMFWQVSESGAVVDP